ncbi:hypothetical protein T492DRAFT_888020 [Pavlovales sp. CCMP2436]|nr:hypothetical protein T492DRAFT_888020 [Pavlovales sp. CCMP2436]
MGLGSLLLADAFLLGMLVLAASPAAAAVTAAPRPRGRADAMADVGGEAVLAGVPVVEAAVGAAFPGLHVMGAEIDEAPEALAAPIALVPVAGFPDLSLVPSSSPSAAPAKPAAPATAPSRKPGATGFPGLHVVPNDGGPAESGGGAASGGGAEWVTPIWLPSGMRPPDHSAGGGGGEPDASDATARPHSNWTCPPLFAREPIGIDDGALCLHEHGVDGGEATDGAPNAPNGFNSTRHQIGSIFEWPRTWN